MQKLNGITIIQAGTNICKGGARKFPYANLTCAIIASAVPDGINIQIIDMYVQDMDYNNIKGQLVFITAFTTDFPIACDVSRQLREKGIPTVFGGIHAHVCPDECDPHFDAVAIGEAELLIEEILKDFEAGNLKKRYAANGYFDIKQSKIPRYDLLMLRRYMYFPLMASKGCAFNCDFCSSRILTGPEYRNKTVEQIISEIRYMKSLYEKDPLVPDSFAFVDSNLYSNRKFLIELLHALIPMRLKPWGMFASANIASDDEVLDLLSKANCSIIQIGFESVNPQTLKNVNKNHNDPRKYAEVVGKLAEKGIQVHASFIFGFDGDDETVFDETWKTVLETNVVHTIFFVLTPFPGTRIYEKLSAEGRILHRDWSKYNMKDVVYKPSGMTAEQLEAGLKKVTEAANDPDRLIHSLNVFAQKSEKKISLSFGERMVLLLLYLFKFTGLKPSTRKLLKKAIAGKIRTNFRDMVIMLSGVQNLSA